MMGPEIETELVHVKRKLFETKSELDILKKRSGCVFRKIIVARYVLMKIRTQLSNTTNVPCSYGIGKQVLSLA